MRLSRRHWLLTAGVGATATGAWFWMRDASSSQQDIKAMQSFTEHMKTYCVGRFLIDAPAAVRDVSGNYETQIASVEARPNPYKSAALVLQALDPELGRREADLRNQPLSPQGGSRFLGSWRGGSAVRVLRYLTPGVEPDEIAEGYVARDGGVFFFKTSAIKESRATELLDFLVEIESSLTMLAPDEIPHSPGFCIGTGLIATNPKRGENVNSWSWTLPGHRDVRFGLSTKTNDDSVEAGIVDREGSIIREAGALLMQQVRTLRKRRFVLAGMASQEWSIATTDDKPEYQLEIEIPGVANDNAHPFIRLEMRVGGTLSGGYVKPSLTTGEALALFDSVAQTLRSRPGAF